MSQQPSFDVFGPQRLTKKGIVEQIYLTHRQIIGGTPVTVKQLKVADLWIAIVGIVGSHVDVSGIGMGQQSCVLIDPPLLLQEARRHLLR
jgi:hypothetical protein